MPGDFLERLVVRNSFLELLDDKPSPPGQRPRAMTDNTYARSANSEPQGYELFSPPCGQDIPWDTREGVLGDGPAMDQVRFLTGGPDGQQWPAWGVLAEASFASAPQYAPMIPISGTQVPAYTWSHTMPAPSPNLIPDRVWGHQPYPASGEAALPTRAKATTSSNKGAKSVRTPAVVEVTDGATTVMLRNLPNRYTRRMFLELLDSHGFARSYDFIYVPMDFRNAVNLGYAFVNLLHHADALRLFGAFQGFGGWAFESTKICEVSWAHPHQGLGSHVERYRNSPVMHPSMPEEYKPMVFHGGIQAGFPAPTKAIRAPKLRPANHREGPRDA